MVFGPTRSLFSLLKWLGPWTSQGTTPAAIRRSSWVLREGQLHGHRAHRLGAAPRAGEPSRLEAYVYHPRREPLGAYLIAPGLHFLGPDDPRLDRFCRVLARAGFLVVAPFLPAFVDLDVRPDAPPDLERFAQALIERLPGGQRPTLFSISFGSWPAFEVASRLGDGIDGVITFGGYADFDATVRFCVDGVMRTPSAAVQLTRDPLNAPALFMNLLPYLDVAGDTEALRGAWRRLVYRTWGKMELKAPGKLEPLAHELLPNVPKAQRELFLVGAGALPGAGDLVEAALQRAGDAFAYACPKAALAQVRCPVVICHGKDDDVIPWCEAEKLVALLPPTTPSRLYLTGLYGHTGAGRPRASDAAREGVTLLRLAHTLAQAGRLRSAITPE